MKAYDQLGLLELLSKTTQKAYMLISADLDLLSENGRQFERAFSMLSDDVLDAICHEGSTVIEFEDLDAAYATYLGIEDAVDKINDITLFAIVYVNGYSQLSIDQSNNMPLIPHQFASASAM